MVWKKSHESSLKELPEPASGKTWQEETGEVCCEDKKPTGPKEHMWWSASTSTATGTFQQFPWMAKRFFGSAVCLEVILLLPFLLFSALQVILAVLNLRVFHGRALKSAPLKDLQELLQVHIFVKLQFQIISRFVSPAHCHSKDKKKKN